MASPKAQPLSVAKAVSRANRWRERYNPLRGLTAERCRALAESYLTGQFQELMWAFGAPFVGIETADPDMLALIERRSARLLEMDWDIRTAEDKAEDPRALRQAAALRDAYERFDELYAAIEHLALGAFRGIAHVEIDWHAGAMHRIHGWNVARDGIDGDWKYNPTGQAAYFDALPDDLRIDPKKHWWLIRTHPRPIGAWALLKYFYSALSARDWASFCTIYGIPGGVVIGPPNVPPDKEDEYATAAGGIAQGGTGYIPHGSEWKPNTDARGTQPFKDWLDWLSSKLILAGTGGMLTMLNDATGLGSGQSESHEDTFMQIARGEARKIGEIFNRQFDRRVLDAAGLLAPGERPLAWWALAAQEETETGEIVTHASTLAASGYRMDPDQLSEKTGYQITVIENPPADPAQPITPTGLQNRCNTLQNRDHPRTGIKPPDIAVRPSSGKISEILDRLEKADSEHVAAVIQEGLALLDQLTPEDLAADARAAELEEVLMRAVIEGAATKEATA
jgi:hypothetical protein